MNFFRLAFAVLAVLCVMQGWAQRPKMNVLFFLVDDMGWMDVGYNGSSFYETPNIDALANDGMIFNRGYAACPVCSPTRAAIMTGKYPVVTGITDYINNSPAPYTRNTKLLPAENKLELDLQEYTIAEAMRDAGYKTHYAGKWHLGKELYFPENQGFDINMGANQHGAPGSFFYPFKNIDVPGAKDGDYLPEVLIKKTCSFIRDNKQNPFFAYHAFYLVHTPIQAKQGLADKYIAKRERMNLQDDTQIMGADVYHKEKHREVRSVQSNAKYAAMVEALDASVGQVIQTLKDEGLYDKTIIVFTSDNGGLSTSEGRPTSNFPLRGGKGYMYEGGIRVPLVIRWPGVTRGGQSTAALACSVDYYPTLADILQVRIPATQKIHGKSLVSALQGKQPKSRTLFWHFPHYGNQGGGPASCMMDGDWKLIYWYDFEKYELFHIGNDPYEKHDLITSEVSRTRKMKKKLDNWLKKSGAKFPAKNPAFQPVVF